MSVSLTELKTLLREATAKAIRRAKSMTLQATPIGVVADFAGSTAPEGWLICDGSTISRTTYADLFAVIGTTYGVGDGSTTFALPDARGRVIAGVDGSANRLTNGDLGDTSGSQTHTLTAAQLPSHNHSINHDHASFTSGPGGEHNHPNGIGMSATGDPIAVYGLYGVNMGTGRLGGTDFGNIIQPTTQPTRQPYTSTVSNHTHSVNVPAYSGTSGTAGSGQAHNNVQPTLVLNKIIRAV